LIYIILLFSVDQKAYFLVSEKRVYMAIHISRMIIVVLLLSLISGCALMKMVSRQEKRKLKGDNFSLNYLLYLPKDYSNEKAYPLVLFLHGAGERGSSIEKVKMHGPPKLIAEGKDFPFILVSPQCPLNERWDVEQLSELLDYIEEEYNVDENRIYITGLSMGGYGAWKMAQSFPDRFAAIVPICGGGDFSNACVIKHLPVWTFHGAKDRVVFLQESERMVNALKRCNGNVRFTVYPDATHDSWTETYNNPEVFEWMLRQVRNN
jgi:predicted peptidase